jgi:hypothetical protein
MKTLSKAKLHMMKAWSWLTEKPWRLAVAIVGTLALLGGLVWFTNLKYVLGGLIVKSSPQVTVTDAKTKLPVPKALVEIAGSAQLTDKSGRVHPSGLHPGKTLLLVRKIGYRDSSQSVALSFGSADSYQVELAPNGIQMDAMLTNKLTGAPLGGVEMRAGDAEALTDSKGQARLSLPPTADNTQVTVNFGKDGYTSTSVPVLVRKSAPTINVALTPAGKVYFLSNRTGNIDLYEANLDGSESKVALAGTGSEDADTGILTNTTDHQFLALVSSREGRRTNGQLQHALFLFDTQNGELTKLDDGVAFSDFRAWLGDTLIYEKNKNDQYFGSCDDLKAFNVSTKKTTTFFSSNLAQTGCPNITAALADSAFYTVDRASDSAKDGVFMVTAEGATKKVDSKPADNTVRRVHQTILSEYYGYESGQQTTQWDSIDVGSLQVTRLPYGPTNENSRYYNDSPSSKYSSFVEERDGKSELYLTDGNGENERKLTSMGSVNQFVQWYGDDYIAFSSTRADENALYVVAVSGGAPTKVSDFYRGNNRTYGGGGNAYY